MHLVGHREELLEEFYKDVFRRVNLLVVVVSEHLDTCINQEKSEDAKNPIELLNDSCTGKDKDTA